MVQGVDNGKPHYWPPGGPYVLSAFMGLSGLREPSAAQGLMSLVSALTTGLVFLMAQALFSRTRWALLAAGLYALSPTTLWMARQSESHTFCALWVASLGWLTVLAWRRPSWGLQLAGAAVGALLVLTRPGSALLMLAWLAMPLARLWWCRAHGQAVPWLPSLAQAGLAAVLFLSLLWPTLQHNHARQGGWVLSTNNERNFFLGNNPYTHPYKTGHLAWRSLQELPPETQAYLKAHYQSTEPRKAMMDSALAHIRQHPLDFVQRTVNRAVNFWSFDYEQGRRLQVHLAEFGVRAWLPLLVQAACSAVLIWLFWCSVLSSWSGPWRWPVLACLGACLLYQAPHVVAFSSPVYRAGLAPLICVVAAAGLGQDLRRSLRLTTLMWVAVALLCVDAQAAYYLYALR
jgi:hypothetical protein